MEQFMFKIQKTNEYYYYYYYYYFCKNKYYCYVWVLSTSLTYKSTACMSFFKVHVQENQALY